MSWPGKATARKSSLIPLSPRTGSIGWSPRSSRSVRVSGRFGESRFQTDGNELGSCPEEDRPLGNSRSRQARFQEPVRRDDRELRAQRHNEHITRLARDIEFSVRRDGRRGEALAAVTQPLAIVRLTGSRIPARKDTGIVATVQVIP